MKTGTETLGFLLHDASRLMRRRFEREGSHLGLSASQWRALVRVVKEDGTSQARLAEFLEIEPISVSRLLDRMEEGGWIERRSDMADRRVRLVYPTEKSRKAFAAIKGVAGEVYETALCGLGDEDRRALVRGLTMMIANLTAADVAALEADRKEGAAA